MATTNLSAISAALSLIFNDPITDQFRRDCPILAMLPIKAGSGKNLAWSVKLQARNTAGAYSEGADMEDGDFSNHNRVGATLNWGQYREGVKISGLSQAAAASLPGSHNAGEASLWNEEMGDAIDALAASLAGDVYGGDPAASPTELAGAAIAVDSDTGVTFAGINPATYGDWVGNEDTIALSAISVENLRTKLHRPIKDATGRNPDVVTVPGNVFDKIVGLADSQTTDVIRVVGNEIRVADLGARAVFIDGVPYIEDRHCTANTAYAWSMRHVTLEQLPAAMPSAREVQVALKNLTGVEVPMADVENGLRQLREPGVLTPTVEMLGQTGDSYKAQIKVYAQMKWRRRNAFGKLVFT